MSDQSAGSGVVAGLGRPAGTRRTRRRRVPPPETVGTPPPARTARPPLRRCRPAPSPPLGDRGRRRRSRHPRWAAALAIVALLVVGLVHATTTTPTTSPADDPSTATGSTTCRSDDVPDGLRRRDRRATACRSPLPRCVARRSTPRTSSMAPEEFAAAFPDAPAELRRAGAGERFAQGAVLGRLRRHRPARSPRTSTSSRCPGEAAARRQLGEQAGSELEAFGGDDRPRSARSTCPPVTPSASTTRSTSRCPTAPSTPSAACSTTCRSMDAPTSSPSPARRAEDRSRRPDDRRRFRVDLTPSASRRSLRQRLPHVGAELRATSTSIRSSSPWNIAP